MAVLLSGGRGNLQGTMCQILDTFITEADLARGIFIKPNIVFPVRPESHEITSPAVVKALIGALRECRPGVDVVLGEGVAAGCDPSQNFDISGYAQLARELGVPLVDLNLAERTKVPWKFGMLDLPSVALKRTYINLPILKSSSACVISGALKNQKGLLLPATKKQFHRRGLHEQIAELNAVVRPSLTVMDCSRFFSRGALLSGNNCGEIDATACHMLSIEEPEHVRLSRNAGVFGTDYSVAGDGIGMRRTRAHPEIREFRRLGRLRLWSNPQACTMCRHIFHDIQRDMLRPRNFRAGVKLLVHSLRGAEIIIGLNPQWRKENDTVICVGECTRRVAKEGGYTHVPGCPPTLHDFYEHLP